MDPGSKSLPHKHQGFEEFYVIDGELEDADGKIFKKGSPATHDRVMPKGVTTRETLIIIITKV